MLYFAHLLVFSITTSSKWNHRYRNYEVTVYFKPWLCHWFIPATHCPHQNVLSNTASNIKTHDASVNGRGFWGFIRLMYNSDLFMTSTSWGSMRLHSFILRDTNGHSAGVIFTSDVLIWNTKPTMHYMATPGKRSNNLGGLLERPG